jgi:hypothetical protein
MGIEQFLTEEDKLASLKRVQELLRMDIFEGCLKCGYDVTTFDYTTFEMPQIDADTVHNINLIYSLVQKSQALVSIDNKIEELENGV